MPIAPTVLIVDDTPAGREVLQSVLAQEGYQILVADSGHAALQLAQTSHPDVILLDAMMPDLDGFEVCRRLRRAPQCAEIPVIMVTALDDRGSRHLGFEAGADDFVSKPVDRIELRLRVRTITRLNRFRRLAEARARFAHLADLSPDGIIAISRDARVLMHNPAAARMFGDELPERDFHELVRPGSLAAFRDWFSRVTPERTAAVRLEAIGRGGARLPLELSGIAAPWEAADAVVCVTRDMSEQIQLRDRLHQGQRLEAIARATSGLAHDFANYLTAIVIGLGLLRGRTNDDQEARELLDEIEKRCEEASALVRQINTFARGGEPPGERVDLGRVAREMEPMLRHLALGADLDVRTPVEPAWVAGDASQMRQIISNLVLNARAAIAESGTILVAVARDEDSVRLDVCDTGAGMDEDTRARIFEPYFTTRTEGTGLGLATVHGIVRACGGRIEVESELGEGTTFAITLPPSREATGR